MLFFPIASLFIMKLMGSSAGAATVTGIMMGIKAITGSASAVLLGRIGDRVGHLKILLFSIIASVCFYFLQAFVNSAWQLILLQALSGLAIGGMIPSLNALMNCHAPSGSQGATYGLNASITAAGRSIAPMLGATIAMWFGMRSVFVVAAAIYGLAVLVVLFISRTEYIKTAS